MKNFKYYLLFLGLLTLSVTFIGCEEDEQGSSPTAAFVVSETSVLKQKSLITFINQSDEGRSYLWSFGDGQVSKEKDPTHIYTDPGTYNVSLEVSANGFRSIASQEIAISGFEFELFFIDNNGANVSKMNLNDTTTITSVFDLSGFSFGLTYDSASQELYYSDDDSLVVFRNSVNGGSESLIASGIDGPRGIALDLANSKVFVAERFGNKVLEINTTTKAITSLFGFDDDTTYLRPVGLDIYDDMLFSTAIEIDAETVWSASTSGENLTRLIDYNAGGFGYAIAIDKVNRRMYFDDNDSGALLSAALDGSDITDIGTSSDRVYGIAINNTLGKVYWASRDGIIKEALLDGSGEKVLKRTDADIRGMILRQIN